MGIEKIYRVENGFICIRNFLDFSFGCFIEGLNFILLFLLIIILGKFLKLVFCSNKSL